MAAGAGFAPAEARNRSRFPQQKEGGSWGKHGFPHAQIGVPRFELGTSPTRTERATRLRHTPRFGQIIEAEEPFGSPAKGLGRRLLLHRQEIQKLIGKTQQKGLTLIPLRIYFRDGIAKCELALARGKKEWDRRQSEREKETRRELSEAMYKYRRR